MIKLVCQVSEDFFTEDSKGKYPIDYTDTSTDEGLEALQVFVEARTRWEDRDSLFSYCKLSALILVTPNEFISTVKGFEALADAVWKNNLPLFKL